MGSPPMTSLKKSNKDKEKVYDISGRGHKICKSGNDIDSCRFAGN
jgi:uncharacterized membrane protein